MFQDIDYHKNMRKNSNKVNVMVDKKLLDKAFKVSGLKTKRELVEKALEYYIEEKTKFQILELLGKIEFDITPEELIKEREKEIGPF